MTVTPSGIVISVRAVESKAYAPIEVTLSGRSTFSRDEQFSKADLRMEVTPSLTTSDVIIFLGIMPVNPQFVVPLLLEIESVPVAGSKE